MADVQIVAGGASTAPLDYLVPGAQEIVLKTLYAEFDGSAAAGAWLPTLEIIAPGGKRVGQYRTQDTVPAGDSAHVTWGPFLSPKGISVTFPRNLGELGASGAGAQASTYTHTLMYENVAVGDRILVYQTAPVLASAAAPFSFPISCTDSGGNSYTNLTQSFWEASPPNVNEGFVRYVWVSAPASAPLVAGVDTITVAWDNPPFDRSILAFLIRNDTGADVPTVLDVTPDGSPAVFASTDVTMTVPAYTPYRDNTLYLSVTTAAKAGFGGGISSVPGYTGFLGFTGYFLFLTKQNYFFSIGTFGADALLINPQSAPRYEIDLGQLPANVLVPAFNGTGVRYSQGVGAYKGIDLFAID